MSDELQGKQVAFLLANSGVEQVELTTPWQAVEDAGGTPVLVAPEKGTVQAFNNDVEKANTFQAELSTKDAVAEDFDALVLPGGTTNSDQLRMDINAVTLVAAFAGAGKPIAAICHGPWTLVEAGVVRGKTVTSWPSLKTDLRNAGAEWRDEEVVVSPEEGYTLITSRNPGDLDAFSKTLVDVVAGSTADTKESS
ncbi:type 1 glutamine amidotransferase domain-containing protein [uncultured Jatrophihabitans sp.]|uniref:type 1 glutamine amidotransferase domain-containing protein n=1 Tax=uncultured Jatrophihabitans sp. TaxID=1610747 RepID=UPI0035CC0DFD